MGRSSCAGGQLADSCTPGSPLAAVDTTCDGVDDDCSGAADEDYVPQACGVGVCAAVSFCAEGKETACTPGSPLAAVDTTCDGVDDDCSGAADEDFAPVDTTCGHGPCASTGRTACVEGQVTDSCSPAVALFDEDLTCDGVDDDCDGDVDDDYQPQAVACGVGACAAVGSTSCWDGEVDEVCTPGSPLAAVDTTCDGVDDDCSGAADEDYAPQGCGVGVCAAVSACAAGKETACTPGSPLAATDTTCDGVDDDCSGAADEDYAPQSCGVGVCAAVSTCAAGKETACTPGSPLAAVDTTCDGVDDDCSGAADEDFAPVDTTCGHGPCASTGRTACVEGQVTDSCSPAVALFDEDLTCDGVDDDCDGDVDDDYQPQAVACGVGACAAVGSTSCWDGEVDEVCTPGSPLAAVDTTCDGVDDDCSGAADEDYAPQGCGVGVCAAVSACAAGKETACTPGSPLAATDTTCDGVDDDCSGAADEDYAPQSCGVGVCAAVSTCAAGKETACTPGSPLAAVDTTCDGVDDDCSGTADEDYAPQACGVGACAAVSACAGGQVTACTPGSPLAANDATWDGIDDDCDGRVDEDCGGLLHRLALTLQEPGQTPGGSSFPRKNDLLEIPLFAGGYLDSSVVAHWRLDGDGADAAQEHDLTVHGAGTAEGFDGTPNGALVCDRSKYLDGPDAADLDGFRAFTVCAWGKPDASPGVANEEMIAVAKDYQGDGDDATDAFALGFGASPGAGSNSVLKPGFVVWSSAGATVRAATPIPAGQWSQVCGVYDGQRLLLYVNGLLAATQPFTGRINATASLLHIGRCGGDARCEGRSFLGALDEVLLLDRPLSPLEVRAYHDSRRPWGTPLLAEMQPDADDLRVLEDGRPIPFETEGALPLADQAADLDGHVLAYWPLDGDAQELTGSWTSTNHGATAGEGRFGPDSGGMAFDGTQWVDSGLSLQPGAGGSFTIELWAKIPVGAGAGRGLVFFGTDMNGGDRSELHFTSYPDGRIYTHLRDASSVSTDLVVSGDVRDGRWHHLAVVRDRSTRTYSLFLDGWLLKQVTDNTENLTLAGLAPYLGAYHDGDDGVPVLPFIGLLDEVVVHDVARSADYLYKRAHPLPRVRFFVATSAQADAEGRYPYRSYALQWGSPEAAASELIPGGGLLSPARGYEGWWRFADVADGLAVDITTNRHHGVPVGANGLPAPAMGSRGAAWMFDGVDDGVKIAPFPAWGVGDELTLEAVAQPASVGGASTVHTLLATTAATGEHLPAAQLALKSPDVLQFSFVDAAGAQSTTYEASPVPLVDGHGHAFALMHQYGQAATTLYQDGSLQAGTLAAGDLSLAPVTSTSLTLGYREGEVQSFHGTLDEARVLSRRAEPAELLRPLPTVWQPADLFVATCVDEGTCLQDSGDVTLDGTPGVAGASPVASGWLPNLMAGEQLAYSNEQASSGSLSIKTSGYNGSGVHALLDPPPEQLDVWVSYFSTISNPVDYLEIGRQDRSAFLRIILRETSWRYRVNGSTNVEVAIPGVPAWSANRWYHLHILLLDGWATFEVSDGVTTGSVSVAIPAIPLESILLGVDSSGGGSHTSYWDDFSASW
jgi:hypothetical protein